MQGEFEMREALVTVIVPTYNYGHFIAESIASILIQGIDDIEVIIVDDASTDETEDIVRGFMDKKIQYIRMPVRSGKVGYVRNQGLLHSNGQFIAFLDADDRWRPNKLKRQLALMNSEPEVGAIFTDFVRFNDTGLFAKTQFEFFPELSAVPCMETKCRNGYRVLSDPFDSFIAFGQFPTWLQTMMFRASSIRDIQFSSVPCMTDDLDFCMRVFQKTSVAYIKEPLVEVRRHGKNASWNVKELELDVTNTLCHLERRISLVQPTHLQSLRRRVGRALVGSGRIHASQGRALKAVQCIARSLLYPGSRIRALKNFVGLPYLLLRKQ